MNPAELHKRVADVLGVSASQKELAFEVLTESIAEILTEGITLKVPRVGFFQLKSEPQKNSSAKQLMFSSLPEDFDRTEKVLYHTFDINPKYKNFLEMDSQVFSIGVGKPLLPLQDEESAHDPETSFAMLRKSIEERVREILAESDQIPNFNIWEDIYSNNDELDLESDISSKLLDITSDLHFNEEPKPVVPEVNKQQQDFLNSLLYSDKPEASEEFFAEEKAEFSSEQESTSDQQFFDEELYKIDEAEPAQNLSVTDLLGETDWMQKADVPLENEADNKVAEEVGPTEPTQNLSVLDLLGDMDWMQKTDLPLNNEVENKEVEETELAQNLSVLDLLGDMDWMHKVDSPPTDDVVKNEITEEPGQTLQEEQIDITIPENFANPAKIEVTESPEDLVDISGETFGSDGELEPVQELEERLPVTSSIDNEVLKNLLSDEKQDEAELENDEIMIEPPSSGKELLITMSDEVAKESKDIWAIEEEDLKGIINEELREYDHEKIADANSRVLNDLLEDAFHRKVETDSTGEFDEEVSADEVPEEQTITGRIEWSWGDELKEEFGIRADEETEIIPGNPFSLVFEDEDFAEPIEFEFDLEKTRQDLFSRLEKTLEKEVTSLHDNYGSSYDEEAIAKKRTAEKLSYSRTEIKTEPPITIVKEEVPPVAEFKDEKVFLDFKTPPPRYEFIEEPAPSRMDEEQYNPHVLTKPKRITILLERNEPEEVVTQITDAGEEIAAEEPRPQRNFFGKLFAITLASLVVVIAVGLYLYFKAGLPNQEIAQQTPTEYQTQNTNSAENPRNAISREALGLNPDDFSEFPTSATPPTPVKEGGSVDVSKIVSKVETKNLPKNEELLRQSQKEELARKTLAAQNNKSASGETRLTDMVFSDGKSYNFQISSWKNKALAQTEVNRLRSQGFNAFLVEAYLPDKGGTWYRIRIGSFKSEQEALDFKKKNSF